MSAKNTAQFAMTTRIYKEYGIWFGIVSFLCLGTSVIRHDEAGHLISRLLPGCGCGAANGQQQQLESQLAALWSTANVSSEPFVLR